MEHPFKAEYANIRLLPLAAGDIESLRIWRNDPDNTKFLRKIPYITPEMQQEWFESYLSDRNELIFSIYELGEKEKLVGSLSLYDIKEDEATFGKILIGDKNAHGKKIGVHATKAAVGIAFRRLNVNRVTLYVFAENAAAVKTYGYAGFHITDEHDVNGSKEYTMEISKTGKG